MAEQIQHFPPSSGRWTGGLGIVLALAVAGVAVTEIGTGWGRATLVGALLAAVVLYAAMLRPRVSLTQDALVLRGMTDTVHLPLVSIEELVVRQLLVVRAGDRRFTNSGLGRSWRTLARTPAARSGERIEIHDGIAPVDFAEERIRQALDDARRVSGVKPWRDQPDETLPPVRRERAWWLVALMGVLAVLFVVLVLA